MLRSLCVLLLMVNESWSGKGFEIVPSGAPLNPPASLNFVHFTDPQAMGIPDPGGQITMAPPATPVLPVEPPMMDDFAVGQLSNYLSSPEITKLKLGETVFWSENNKVRWVLLKGSLGVSIIPYEAYLKYRHLVAALLNRLNLQN